LIKHIQHQAALLANLIFQFSEALRGIRIVPAQVRAEIFPPRGLNRQVGLKQDILPQIQDSDKRLSGVRREAKSFVHLDFNS